MPNDETRKTKSARKWARGAIVVVAIVAGLTWLWWQMTSQQQVVQLHGHLYGMTVMRTDEELQRGLSGTQSLPADQAMLFVFPTDDKWAMWMKDMNYPIDMVWLGDDKKVVYMVKNAQPSSYPKTQFKPDTNTRYVIELPSGTIERTGIAIGDPAGLPSGV